MSFNWKTKPLGEVASNVSRRFNFTGKDKVIFINTGDVLEGAFLHSDYSDTKGLPGQAKKAIEKGDILYSEIRPGNKRYVLVDFDPKDYVVSTKFMVIKPSDEILPEFLYLILTSRDCEQEFKIIADSRSGTFPQVTFDSISYFPINYPDKAEQKRILQITDSLSGKLAVNAKTNQTLEQIAQSIFKSWFVDFDPVKAKIETLAAGGSADDAELAAMGVISAKTLDELNSLKASNPEAFNKLAQTAALFPKNLDSETGTPAGWNSGVIADIAKLNANSWTKKNRPEQVHYVDLSNTKNGRIETVTTYGFDEAPSRARRILNSGDTIIGTVRPGNRAFAFIGETEKPLTGSTGFAVLSPKEEFWTSFVYLATTNDDAIDEYARLADGGAYPAIKPEVVADTPCVLPTKDIAQKFWQLTGAMLKKAHQARLENEELTKTRDTLLPKLLSCEINVTSEVVE
ncbi:restriction endonuclease subunit S [Vibrio cholerae]|uniref:restriction endonuclease subunit S n=1 Tax=Vibrio cholerae TaxID=666 RepID=UPI0022F33622|nr:restriction endonuclease subunit S [Vibrio cholerae]MDA5318469.1 restriction endonuclease subunit S [Vibrio cholerae]